MILIHPSDNILVSPTDGQKYARRAIEAGERIIKYGYPIGRATCFIAEGEHVHSHNMKTKLGDLLSYEYSPKFEELTPIEPFEIEAYVRKDGNIGIRNDIWIVPTVGCVNYIAKALAEKTGALCFSHPYGCSQLGGDHKTTQLILKGLINHPNAGGVLVVGLGCENNTLESFRARLGDVSDLNIRFLLAQDPGDEYARGLELIKELEAQRVSERTEIPVSELIVGLKCGGSDGFSGLTANPLVGRFSDWIVARPGKIMTAARLFFSAGA